MSNRKLEAGQLYRGGKSKVSRSYRLIISEGTETDELKWKRQFIGSCSGRCVTFLESFNYGCGENWQERTTTSSAFRVWIRSLVAVNVKIKNKLHKPKPTTNDYAYLVGGTVCRVTEEGLIIIDGEVEFEE